MDKNLEQLARYVGQQLQQGVQEQAIRSSLAQNRWTDEWIDAAFNIVRQNPTAFSLPPSRSNLPTRPVDSIAANTYAAAQPSSAPPGRGANRKGRKILLVLTVLLILAVTAYALLPSATPNQPSQQGDTAQSQQTKNPDEQRKEDLNTLLSDLADVFVASSYYPTLDTLNHADFAAQNTSFDTQAFADPEWTNQNTACTVEGEAVLSRRPALHCYAYSAAADKDAACDNTTVFCTRMTLAATLEDGTVHAVTLDRNTEIEED